MLNIPIEKAVSSFLKGNFAPWRSEGYFSKLEVVGEIPDDLSGVLLRNGPNPQFDPVGAYHWFEGDGMLHAIRIHNGCASYDNRWVRTERFNLENKAGKAIFNSSLSEIDSYDLKSISGNTANTNIITYQQKLLALNEGALPVEIQLNNLNTLGEYTFNEQIKRNLTAHPRYDFKNKELITYSYINESGGLFYYRLDRNNQLIVEKKIHWPYPAMIHDFVNTENYVIFPIFPCTMSTERMMNGENIFMWEGDRLNTFYIVVNKQGDEITRFETDPCYVYHFGNAYECGDEIIIDAMLGKCTPLMPDRFEKIATRENSDPRLARIKLNLKTNAHNLKYCDDISGEFPRFDERFNGNVYRHLYVCGGNSQSADWFDRIMHYDLISNIKREHYFSNDLPSEPVFVPTSEKEGEGYLLTVVYRVNEDRSDVVILDTDDISKEPLAIIKIPHRIPFGFHGNFVKDNVLNTK